VNIAADRAATDAQTGIGVEAGQAGRKENWSEGKIAIQLDQVIPRFFIQQTIPVVKSLNDAAARITKAAVRTVDGADP